jgi:hypothetical protein
MSTTETRKSKTAKASGAKAASSRTSTNSSGGRRPNRARASVSRSTAAKRSTYRCPECGRTFERPQALGAHRRQAHGIAGESKRSQSRAAAARRRGSSTRSRRPQTTQRTQQARRAAQASNSASRDGRNRTGGRPTAVNRDALLKALFPQGIPAREDVIRDVADWLDHAERLVRSR